MIVTICDGVICNNLLVLKNFSGKFITPQRKLKYENAWIIIIAQSFLPLRLLQGLIVLYKKCLEVQEEIVLVIKDSSLRESLLRLDIKGDPVPGILPDLDQAIDDLSGFKPIKNEG